MFPEIKEHAHFSFIVYLYAMYIYYFRGLSAVCNMCVLIFRAKIRQVQVHDCVGKLLEGQLHLRLDQLHSNRKPTILASRQNMGLGHATENHLVCFLAKRLQQKQTDESGTF